MSHGPATIEPIPPAMKNRILRPGENCWRIEEARRAAFLIDGAAYFKAVRSALRQARQQVLILGWDIDSRVQLIPGENDGYPQRLGAFLYALLDERPELHIHVLVWDFSIIFALEREWAPVSGSAWQNHPRLHFRMDSNHPTGGSQHQKIIVVDDSLAFVGGMDLSKWRWDTPEHRAKDERRRGPEGHLYAPYHDVQIALSGDVATRLGMLARERWYRATQHKLPEPHPRFVWPELLAPDLQSVAVALARTDPNYDGRPEITEVEKLFHDAFRAARRWIYVENQYFTSQRIAQTLIERLKEPGGPEIVMVLPKHSSGWLEQHTMDVLRARLLQPLKEADRYARLTLYYPESPAVAPDYINVHDKVMVVDDRFLRIGSANLSNRSMRLDTECDVAMEADDSEEHAPLRQAIGGFRNRLIAEHLDAEPQQVNEAINRFGSLRQAIESLQQPHRYLAELNGTISAEVDEWVPDADLIDPEQAIDPATLVNRFVDDHNREPVRRHLVRNISLLLLAVALAVAWRWTPLREVLELRSLLSMVAGIRDLAFSPLLILGGYVLGGVLAVPVTALIVVTVLVYGPAEGFFYALSGSMLSAIATYAIGNQLGHDTVQRLAGSTVHKLSQRLARRGVLTMTVIRMLPVAPFSVVNLIAGASHIRFRDYLLGTLLGMLPGILAITIFVDRIEVALRNPEPQAFVWLIVVTVLIILAAYWVRRALIHRAPPRNSPTSPPED